MKLLGKFALVSALVILSGCASTNDIEQLQVQIDALSPKIASANLAASEAKDVAGQALVKASAAEEAATRAAKAAEEVNAKLDRFFAKTQYK